MNNRLEHEILAVSLGEAVRVAERAGLRVEINYTSPPTNYLLSKGKERVVRFRVLGSTGILVVANEEDAGNPLNGKEV